MKKLLATIGILAFALANLFAQAPEKMNYQGVARDNSGNILANQAVGLQLSIHSGTPTGTIVYTETQNPTTNQFGLFNIEFGGGAGFNTINWGGNSYYLQVEMDASGGSSYQDMGTAQLLSVPYALYAKASGTPSATGATGATGLPGTNGINGGTGPTGATGADGADGTSVAIQGSVATSGNLPTSGNSEGDGYITQNTGHLWIWDGSNWVDAGLIQGPAGANGSNGATGATGSTGADGAANAWGLSGNATTVSGNFIGTTDAQPLKFSTNNTQRMVITETGNIGIGEPAPSYPIDMTYTGASFTGLNIDYGYTANSAGTGLYIDASTTGTGNLIAAYFQPTASGSANESMGVYGFNTANAGNNLGIKALATGTATGTNYGALFYAANGATGNYGIKAYSSARGLNNWAGYFGSGPTGTSSGKVFIKDTLALGTTVPSASLHVVGDIKIVDGTQGAGKVLTSNSSGLASWQTPTTYTAGTGLSLSGSTINSVWTASGNNIYNNNSANVGIGTASPSSLFHEAGGNFLVTGTFGSGNDIEVNGVGTRMYFNPKKAAFRAGYVSNALWDNTYIGDYSVAMGRNTRASGSYSTAIGYDTKAINPGSTAMGVSTTAQGAVSTAMGENTTANGLRSTAMGYGTIANGDYSVATGRYTEAKSYVEMVIGAYNTSYIPASANTWDVTDRLFVIGNGTTSATSDALVVLKNGNTGIGTSIPQTKLEINQNSANVEYMVRLSNDNGNGNDLSGSGIEFGRGTAMWGQIAGKQELIGDYSSGKLLFNTRSSENLTTKMVILSSGNVGIGNTAPSSTLEINGGFATTLAKPTGTGAITLDNTAAVWYITSALAAINFPDPSICLNRRYIIVNRSGSSRITSLYTNIPTGAVTTIANNSSIEIISDGTNWLQIK
jgi:hypothetical protein